MRRPPLLIFGLDAADPDLLLDWAQDGTLPTIASILERGTRAALDDSRVVTIHEIWTSFFSGTTLDRHGYYARSVLVPGSYRVEPLAADDVDAQPFWSRLAGTDKSAVVLDVPDGRLVPGLRGCQLMGWGEHPTPDRARALPGGLVEEAPTLAGARIRTGERHWARWHDRWCHRRILERVGRKRDLCARLLERYHPDLLVVVFGDAHAAGHRFTKYSGSGGGAGGAEASVRRGLGEALRDVYRAIDSAIGDLLRGLPKDANVFVATNCGIREGYSTAGLLRASLTELGYTIERPPATIAERARAAYARAVPSSLRDLVEWPMPPRWGAALRGGAFRACLDWSKTRCFALPSEYNGCVRVNLAGREPLGTVDPGRDYDALLDHLSADLLELVDAHTGAPVVERTVRADALFGGGPPERLPDLFVHWRGRLTPATSIVHPRARLASVQMTGRRGNYHSRRGLVIGAGSSIATAGDAGAFAASELAPLFVELLGERPERAPREALRNAFLSAGRRWSTAS